jgi:hypothetical protein
VMPLSSVASGALVEFLHLLPGQAHSGGGEANYRKAGHIVGVGIDKMSCRL